MRLGLIIEKEENWRERKKQQQIADTAIDAKWERDNFCEGPFRVEEKRTVRKYERIWHSGICRKSQCDSNRATSSC